MRQAISEKEVQDTVLGVFKYDENIHLWRRNIGGVNVANANGKKRFVRFCQAGQSDLYGYVNIICSKCGTITKGIHVEIEIKASNGHLTTLQEQWIAQTLDNDAIAFVFKPRTNEELLNCRKIIAEEINKHCPHCKRADSQEKRPEKRTIGVEEFKRRYGKAKKRVY